MAERVNLVIRYGRRSFKNLRSRTTIKQLIRNSRKLIRNVTKSPAIGGCPQR